MLEAITYQDMLRDIAYNRIKEDIIGILFTRPDLDVGKSILNSLNYYHHLSGYNTNFYLPGYGAYWYGKYPDGQVVTRINGTEWSFSDKMFVDFVNDFEKYSRWEYSGESELLMVEYKDGRLFYDRVIQFYLDNMLRDNVIVSIPSFFQELLRICRQDKSLQSIRNTFGGEKLIHITGEGILNNIPAVFGNTLKRERYFCIKNYNK